MGTWGNGNFEHDLALDFTGDFVATPTLQFLEAALAAVVTRAGKGSYIDPRTADNALTAAELLAAKLANPAPDFPAEALPALTALPDATRLQAVARTAVGLVMQESELRALWTEAGELAEWLAIQEDLLARLG